MPLVNPCSMLSSFSVVAVFNAKCKMRICSQTFTLEHSSRFTFPFLSLFLSSLSRTNPCPPPREQARDVCHAGINRGCVAFARRRSDVVDNVSDIFLPRIVPGGRRAALLQAATAALGTDPCLAPCILLTLQTTRRWLTASSRNSGTTSRGCPNI